MCEIINIISAYAPQTGCSEDEKDKFWEELDEELRSIPSGEKIWIGGDFNRHCGSDNTGKERTIGKYGVGNSNKDGDKFVAFAMSHDLRVVNTYFKKAERHKITYASANAKSQIDYILCRASEKNNIKDCKVVLGESVTSQHRPVICTIRTTPKDETRKLVGIPRTKWWKLNETEKRRQCATEATRKL